MFNQRESGLRNLRKYNENRHLGQKAKTLTQEQAANLYNGSTNGIPEDIFGDIIDTVKSCKEVPDIVNSGFKKEDAMKLLLYYMVEHDQCTGEDLQKYNVPKAQWAKIIRKLEPAIHAFTESSIRAGTLSERKALGQECFPAPFKDYTGVIDGVHIRLCGQSVKGGSKYFKEGDFRSHKFNYNNAVCYQVVVNAAGQAILVDQGNPAGVHDYRCLWRASFDNVLSFPEDKLLADCGYMGTRIRLSLTTPSKKPKDGDISITEQRKNKAICSARARVEHFFGVAKGRFDFLRKYRGPLKFLTMLVKFAFAIINECLIRGIISEEEKEVARAQFLIDECKNEDHSMEMLHLDPVYYYANQRVLYSAKQMEEEQWLFSANVGNLSQQEYSEMVLNTVNHYQTIRQEALSRETMVIAEMKQHINAEHDRLLNFFLAGAENHPNLLVRSDALKQLEQQQQAQIRTMILDLENTRNLIRQQNVAIAQRNQREEGTAVFRRRSQAFNIEDMSA